MNRERRRRLLLRAHAAAKRFCKKSEGSPYFVPATDAFVAGWLLGYRAATRDARVRFDSLYGGSPPGAVTLTICGEDIAPTDAEADRRFGQPHYGHDEPERLHAGDFLDPEDICPHCAGPLTAHAANCPVRFTVSL